LLALLVIACVKSAASGSNNPFKSSCTNNDDCVKIYNEYYECIDQKCVHKSFLKPSFLEIIGYILVFITNSVATTVGMGGGAVNVPILIIFFGYVIKNAIPLSKAAVLGGAVGNAVMILNKRDPANHNKLIIEFRIASVIIPVILVGNTMGVILLKLLPSLIIILLMFTYLSYSTIKIFKKWRISY
jgi:uncharacterized membrane protein YfcA